MGVAKFDELLNLLKDARLRSSTQGSRGLLIASESDKGRVINSGAFRRLQQKAQVFPLEPNASVRTRLTHSIEVSQIGRHIAQRVIERFDRGAGKYERLAAFVNTIETACLLHDIGNPPFGHLGEFAVNEWFSDKKNKCMVPDLQAFDGNPQGFRLMSFLAGADDFGFNLTSTLLLSTVKYPWSLSTKPKDKKKIGLFSGDLLTYENACEQVQWQTGKRFPFVRLMDTADDIAYSMSDLEDGLEKNIISLDDLKKEFGSKRFPSGALSPFIAFKVKVINDAVKAAANRFCNDIDGIVEGHDFELIEKTSTIGRLLNKVNRFAQDRIYSNESAEKVELAGRSVIKGLLNHFGELIKLSEIDFLALMSNDLNEIKDRQLNFQIRLLRRIPPSYLRKYKVSDRGDEKYRRCHLIVDLISGMTDDFALETYQILEGIRIK